ncbi:hypothetical protein SASPL_115690 [Salvia splendens]|uniref:4-coumarate--CoA ligase n=1 Tax=Salvia splendens TaxID=180675 RepID=A0A8X9A1V2_SALSN|nr:hypothetical protein SASPL_115690 [Salvia splendens]
MLHSYSELIRSKSTTSLPTAMQNDAAAIFYSSGTTGASKGVVLTHKNIMTSAMMMASDQELNRESRNVFLCFLPMYHIFGMSGLVYAQLQRGTTVVVMRWYQINAMLKAIEQYKVTHVFAVPPVVLELIKKQDMVKEYDVQGPLAPSVEAQIVDSVTMQRLSPFQKGYFNNHKATAEIIDEEGWLHTGDVGYFDDEGRLYIVDRIKELIKYKGFQVAPSELEDLLLTHPEIVDAAVIG